jgi:hypothetical protein
MNEITEDNERALIVDFDDIILNTSIVIEKLCNFLDIEELPIMNSLSISGVVLDQSSGGYLGKISDDTYLSLDDRSIRNLERVFGIWKTGVRQHDGYI